MLAHAGVTLAGDQNALARLHVQAFGGTLESARASTPAGKAVPLEVHDGLLTPRIRLTPGERIDVDVVVRRPGTIAWALGKTKREHLVVTTPTVALKAHWLTVAAGAPVTLAFDHPVAGSSPGPRAAARSSPPPTPSRSPAPSPPGSTTVAVAARTWERLQPAAKVTWFPRTSAPAVVSVPANGDRLSPLGAIKLTFAKTVEDALGREATHDHAQDARPLQRARHHTLVFTPRGNGFGIGGGTVRVTLPNAVALVRHEHAHGPRPGLERPGALDAAPPAAPGPGGYLPLDWSPSAGAGDVPRTRAAQAEAAVAAPDGAFTWKYANTPHELKRQWTAGQANTILRGAIMQFQDTHHLTVDGFAGPLCGAT